MNSSRSTLSCKPVRRLSSSCFRWIRRSFLQTASPRCEWSEQPYSEREVLARPPTNVTLPPHSPDCSSPENRYTCFCCPRARPEPPTPQSFFVVSNRNIKEGGHMVRD